MVIFETLIHVDFHRISTHKGEGSNPSLSATQSSETITCIDCNRKTPILGSTKKEPAITQLFMYDDLAKLLQKGLAKEGRFSERLSIF